MTLAKRTSLTRSLLNHLVEQPDLARTIQALPTQTFAALVRKIGMEDAGELVLLATTEQLIQAFDEDLFVSNHAGERETLDADRFVAWLEVLVDVGDEVAADRVAELDEDFVAHALSGVLLVLDEEALRERLGESDEDEFHRVDKALESALTEDMDGYILVAKQHDGWDAALALILALDRNHRALLVRLLDRLARVGRRYLDDLEGLSTVLSEGESLAEDVEAAREERRAEQGHVEPQAARAFLTLARKPTEHDERGMDRDPLTRAYFRGIDRSRVERGAPPASKGRVLPHPLQRELDEIHVESARVDRFQVDASSRRPARSGPEQPGLALRTAPEPPTMKSRQIESGIETKKLPPRTRTTAMGAFMDAMRALSRSEPRLFGERMEEFAYLTNVLVAGHERHGARLRPKEAADAVISTVCYGAILEVHARRATAKRKEPWSRTELVEVLRKRSADVLFRVASRALVTGSAPKVKASQKSGLLYSAEELEAALSI